ncbi:MAG: hypothetical protein IKK21_01575 [Clostridia bacterium]|nr:hypothetical protein [Clostridia bacterium]
MRRLIACAMCAVMLGGCTALPAEERAFAVCLGLSCAGDVWEACARLPEYTTPGKYLTVSARGGSLAEAMTLLDAAAPMRLHYGQVRLVILTRQLAETDAFGEVLGALAQLGEFRSDAYLCVTESPLTDMMDALTPQSGTRLSKYIEVMFASRIGLGVTPDARMGEIRRMGQRQSPLLADIGLTPKQVTGAGGLDASAGSMDASGVDIQLGGAWLLALDGRVQGRLTAGETQLAQLLMGKLRKGALMLPGGSFRILDASADVSLHEKNVRCRVTLHYSDARGLTADGIRNEVESAALSVAGKLAAADCDALGLGRRMMRRCIDWQAWQLLDWRTFYPQLDWQITVSLQGEA